MIRKPMLAGSAPDDLDTLTYPLYQSLKLDGIRGLCLPPVQDGKKCRAVTRTYKPIPNDFIRNHMEANFDPGFDGEVGLADPTALFKEVSSAVMKKSGEPDFRYRVFDHFGRPLQGLDVRLDQLHNAVVSVHARSTAPFRIEEVSQLLVFSPMEVRSLLRDALESGYEGSMLRSPHGIYKEGRSTTKEEGLLKLKYFVDEEATVLSIVEQMKNNNVAEKDAFGRTKRSSAKAGKVGKGTMGKLECMFADGTKFHVGTGFDDEERGQIWFYRDDGIFSCVGQTVKIKHQPDPGGRKEGQKPRLPVFLGFRNPQLD